MTRLGYTPLRRAGRRLWARPSPTRWACQAPEGAARHPHQRARAVPAAYARSFTRPTAGRTPSRNARPTTAINTFTTDGIACVTGVGDPTADAVLPAGFTRRPGGLDARPRHGQLLARSSRGVRRRPGGRRPHPGQRPRQRHAVLADGHRGLGLGGSGRPRRALLRRARACPCRLPYHFPGELVRGPAELGRAGLPRPRPISTRSTGAATSPPGRSPSCSPPSSATAFRSLR